MATIGSLIANLGLETAAFHRDLGKAVTGLQSGAAQMNRSLAGIERQAAAVGRAAVGMLGVFSVGAFAAAMNRSLNLAEAIGDLAKNTRLSTSAVQEFQFAVSQSGGSVDGFNNAIGFFNKVIGEAVNGSREARDALARVGITMQDLQHQNIEQMWVRANDSISKYAGSGRAAADVQALFGKEARASASAFSLAATELEGLRQTARASGQVLDESFIRQAQQAKDELEKFGRVIDVNLTQAMLNFAPHMVKFTKFLSESSEMMVWMGQNMGLLDVTTQSEQYQRLLEKGHQLNEEVYALEQSSKSWLSTLLGDTPQATQRLAEARSELAEIYKQIREHQNRPKDPPKPDPAAAGGTITPTGGFASVDEFGKLMEGMRQVSAKAQMDILADEYSKTQARIKLAESEWRFKADAARLSKDQRIQFEEELSQYLADKTAAELTKIAEEKEKKQQDAAADFERLRMTFDAEYAAEEEKRVRLLQLDAYYRELGLEQDEQYNAIREQIETDHQARLGDKMAKAKQEGQKFLLMSLEDKIKTVVSFGNSELAAVANSNKAIFNLHKALAIADLAIQAPDAIGAAIQRGGGLPWGAVFGTMTAVKYGALLARAKSANFGSSSSPASVAGGTAIPVMPTEPMSPALPPQTQAAAGPERVVNITLNADGPIDQNWLRDKFIPELNDAAGDRVTISIV